MPTWVLVGPPFFLLDIHPSIFTGFSPNNGQLWPLTTFGLMEPLTSDAERAGGV